MEKSQVNLENLGEKTIFDRKVNKKVYTKNESGITLIVLVISIVIIIILSAIALNFVFGENGILTKTEQAKEVTKIAELTEELEMEKGDVQVNNNGKVTLEQYIEHLLEKNIITEDDILETEDEDVKNIVLEDHYEFLLEEINGNDVKITYKGKITLLTVSFDSNGGSECEPIRVSYQSEYGELPEPTKEGYTFAGWYTEEENDNGTGEQIFSTSILTEMEDRTLYARWTVNSYTITFDSNGGSACGSIQVNYKESFGNLPTPTRTGYTFAGWYTEESNNNGTGTQVTSSTVLEEPKDTTIYAQWTINSYTITYVMNGGTNNSSNVTRANYGTTVTLYNPTRSTCTFNGWYTDSSMTNKVTSVTLTGNITLYAKWSHSSSCYGTVTQYHQLHRNRSSTDNYNMPNGCPYPGHTNCSVQDVTFTYYYTCGSQTHTFGETYRFTVCNDNGYVFNESGTDWYDVYPNGYPCNNHTELKCGF